jgi:PTH1 family peptidyl-tRNA hydrolase
MKLIIGLGNPEERYKHTRHNIGFRVITTYAASKGCEFQLKDKFRACLAEFSVDGEKILLAKPTTYYNHVGEAALLLSQYYKIKAEDILLIHDELALPFGTIRTRRGGSDAGNNGIKSMNQHLGDETARIRIGVYNDLRDRIDDADFVLGTFTKQEAEQFDAIAAKTASVIDAFIRDDFEHTTHT